MVSENSPEGKFPFGKRGREKAVEDNRKDIEKFLPVGAQKIHEGHYDWIDSHLDDAKDGKFQWGESFFGTFERVLPGGNYSLQGYIEGALEHKKGNAIGIEFGGIGSQLFSDFSEGFFSKSLGVTLIDHRRARSVYPPFSKMRDEAYERDKKIHHTVMERDIFSPKFYASVQEWLGDKRADLIIERLAKGMEFVPLEPHLLFKTLQTWWDFLAKDGVLLAQVPVELNPVFELWAEMLKQKHPSIADYVIGTNDGTSNASALRLRKFPGSPEALPGLDPRTVREISKKNAGRGV